MSHLAYMVLPIGFLVIRPRIRESSGISFSMVLPIGFLVIRPRIRESSGISKTRF